MLQFQSKTIIKNTFTGVSRGKLCAGTGNRTHDLLTRVFLPWNNFLTGICMSLIDHFGLFGSQSFLLWVIGK